MRNHCYVYNTDFQEVKFRAIYLTQQNRQWSPCYSYLHWPSCLSNLSLSLTSVSSFPIPHPGRRMLNATDAHSLTFQSISFIITFFCLILPLFSQESWCHFKESMSWETLWAPISLSFFSVLSHTFWLKPKHLKEAPSVIASPNFIKIALVQSLAQFIMRPFDQVSGDNSWSALISTPFCSVQVEHWRNKQNSSAHQACQAWLHKKGLFSFSPFYHLTCYIRSAQINLRTTNALDAINIYEIDL